MRACGLMRPSRSLEKLKSKAGRQKGSRRTTYMLSKSRPHTHGPQELGMTDAPTRPQIAHTLPSTTWDDRIDERGPSKSPVLANPFS